MRAYGKIPNTPDAVKAAAAELARGGSELRFCYEAGPCGYGIQRQLAACGHECAQAGKLPTVVTAAIARELSGFVWSIAQLARQTND